jgi:hypothetical protein
MDERVLEPKLSGYIRKEKLEKLLQDTFGGNIEDFEVRVGIRADQALLFLRYYILSALG